MKKINMNVSLKLESELKAFLEVEAKKNIRTLNNFIVYVLDNYRRSITEEK